MHLCHEFHSNVLNHKYPWTQRSNAFWQIFAWDYKSLELFEAFLLFWYWILKRLRWEREALSKVLKGTSSICPRFYFAASLHFAPSGFFCTRFSKFPTPKKFLKEILVLRSSQFKARLLVQCALMLWSRREKIVLQHYNALMKMRPSGESLPLRSPPTVLEVVELRSSKVEWTERCSNRITNASSALLPDAPYTHSL